MGHTVDAALTRNLTLRLLGSAGSAGPRRQERHRGVATLKTGEVLDGYYYHREDGRNAFTPERHQPDGSVWVNADTVSDVERLPNSIRIYTDNQLSETKLTIDKPHGLELEPGFAKILLACIHIAWGSSVVECIDFEPLRDFIHGRPTDLVRFVWVPNGMEPSPIPIAYYEHLIWFESRDGKLVTFVCLFGKLTLKLYLDSFRLPISRSHVRLWIEAENSERISRWQVSRNSPPPEPKYYGVMVIK